MTVKVIRYTPEQIQRELADLYVIAEQARENMTRYERAEAKLAAAERRIEALEYLAEASREETQVSDYQAGYQAIDTINQLGGGSADGVDQVR